MITKSKLKETNIIVSNELAKKIKDKKYSLQFLPESFNYLTDVKFIMYKDRKLKSDYLIDIVNNLILKYYFKKDNRYIINATILKDKYGYIYNYYINYLIDNNVLILKNNYKKGVRSRVYSLNSDIFREKIHRYKNYDKVLLKKSKKKAFKSVEMSDDEVNHIDIDIKQKLISDLYNVKIDKNRSIFYLDSLKDRDIDIYNRNLYSVDSINNKHIFYHFDNYGRMHTNFTILKSFIRKNCLLLNDTETFEIDISNSQPLFLTKMIKESETNWVKSDEFDMFKYLTVNGIYYQYMMDKLGVKNRKDVKNLTYKVLFGKNGPRSKADSLFRSVFPTIHKFITLYKKEHDNYKVLSHQLQKMESELIFNKIIKKVSLQYPDISIITVHDSVIIPVTYKDEVNAIFQSELLSVFDF